MAEPQSSAETQNTVPNQPAGNNGGSGGNAPPPTGQPTAPNASPTAQPNAQAPPPPQPPSGGGSGGDNGAMIPKSRFDEVIAKRKEIEQQLAQLREENEKFKQAQMTDQEKREAEFQKLQEQAKQADLYKRQWEEAEAINRRNAELWLNALSDDQKEIVGKFATANGIEEGDVLARHSAAMSLQAAGLLATQPTKPQPPPTHASLPGPGMPGVPDPKTAAGMAHRLKKAFMGNDGP